MRKLRLRENTVGAGIESGLLLDSPSVFPSPYHTVSQLERTVYRMASFSGFPKYCCLTFQDLKLLCLGQRPSSFLTSIEETEVPDAVNGD
jgi:hypothetical protein